MAPIFTTARKGMASAILEQTRSCCEAQPQRNEEKLFSVLEKTCAVALVAFAAYVSLELFLPFFLAGAAIGIYQRFARGEGGARANATACSQGFMEQLLKVKLPPLVSLGVNLAITWCHIQHHTVVFVPVIALTTGDWAGQMAAGWWRA